jgi:hypothetical protein
VVQIVSSFNWLYCALIASAFSFFSLFLFIFLSSCRCIGQLPLTRHAGSGQIAKNL